MTAHLIGPRLFAVYWYTLRSVLYVAALVCVGLASLELLTTGDWIEAMAHLWYRVMHWTLLIGLGIACAVSTVTGVLRYVKSMNKGNARMAPAARSSAGAPNHS